MNKFGHLAYACTFPNPDGIRSVRLFDIVLGLALHLGNAFIFFQMLPAEETNPALVCFLPQLLAIAFRQMLPPDLRPPVEKLFLMQFFGSAVILGVFAMMLSIDVVSDPTVAFSALLAHSLISAVMVRNSYLRSIADASPLSVPPDAALRLMRAARIEEFGPPIGMIMDHPIPQWIQLSNGKVLHYKRYVGNSCLEEMLSPGELLIAPGLLYAEDDGPA